MEFEHKHTFIYSSSGTKDSDYPNQTLIKEFDGDVTLTGMLSMFKEYLLGVGFIFDGELEIIRDEQNEDEPKFFEASYTVNTGTHTEQIADLDDDSHVAMGFKQ